MKSHSQSPKKPDFYAISDSVVEGLPSTTERFKKLLKKKRNLDDYNLHFLIFLVLSGKKEKQSRCILELCTEYLMNAKNDTRKATWMAGDLLGDHWENELEAKESLTYVLRNAKSRYARGSAVYGLYELINRMEDKKGKKEIRDILLSAKRSEKSDSVKMQIDLYVRLSKK